jgi:hypothetical protein
MHLPSQACLSLVPQQIEVRLSTGRGRAVGRQSPSLIHIGGADTSRGRQGGAHHSELPHGARRAPVHTGLVQLDDLLLLASGQVLDSGHAASLSTPKPLSVACAFQRGLIPRRGRHQYRVRVNGVLVAVGAAARSGCRARPNLAIKPMARDSGYNAT